MTTVVPAAAQPSSYVDRHWRAGPDDYKRCIRESATVYVGNLSFASTEEQVWQVFSMCGEVKRVIMGINKYNRTPCGFCFVEYYQRGDALESINLVSHTKVDGRIIRVDMDPGFRPGRQFGRGQSGFQVRDEHRKDDDPGRGGTAEQVISITSERVNRAYQGSTYFHGGFGSGGEFGGFEHNPRGFDNARLGGGFRANGPPRFKRRAADDDAESFGRGDAHGRYDRPRAPQRPRRDFGGPRPGPAPAHGPVPGAVDPFGRMPRPQPVDDSEPAPAPRPSSNPRFRGEADDDDDDDRRRY